MKEYGYSILAFKLSCYLFFLKWNHSNPSCPSYEDKNLRVSEKNNLRPVSRKPAQKDHEECHSPVDEDKQDETLNILNTTQCGPDQTYITVL